jgi:hypothetical protein
MNEAAQLDLLRNVFPHFRNEYDAISWSTTGKRGEFYFDNGLFSGTDALVAYCMFATSSRASSLKSAVDFRPSSPRKRR